MKISNSVVQGLVFNSAIDSLYTKFATHFQQPHASQHYRVVELNFQVSWCSLCMEEDRDKNRRKSRPPPASLSSLVSSRPRDLRRQASKPLLQKTTTVYIPKVKVRYIQHPHIVWKLAKMSYLNFCFLAFSTNFCPIKTDLSGNTVWPQASGCQKLAKMDHFWHF